MRRGGHLPLHRRPDGLGPGGIPVRLWPLRGRSPPSRSTPCGPWASPPGRSTPPGGPTATTTTPGWRSLPAAAGSTWGPASPSPSWTGAGSPGAAARGYAHPRPQLCSRPLGGGKAPVPRGRPPWTRTSGAAWCTRASPRTTPRWSRSPSLSATPQGQPLSGARVAFSLLNMGELAEIASRTTGPDGAARLRLGKGSVWVTSQAGGLWGRGPAPHRGVPGPWSSPWARQPPREAWLPFDFAAPPAAASYPAPLPPAPKTGAPGLPGPCRPAAGGKAGRRPAPGALPRPGAGGRHLNGKGPGVPPPPGGAGGVPGRPGLGKTASLRTCSRPPCSAPASPWSPWPPGAGCWPPPSPRRSGPASAVTPPPSGPGWKGTSGRRTTPIPICPPHPWASSG